MLHQSPVCLLEVVPELLLEDPVLPVVVVLPELVAALPAALVLLAPAAADVDAAAPVSPACSDAPLSLPQLLLYQVEI